VVIASDLAAVVIVVASTALVVVVVLGLFVWGAIQRARARLGHESLRVVGLRAGRGGVALRGAGRDAQLRRAGDVLARLSQALARARVVPLAA